MILLHMPLIFYAWAQYKGITMHSPYRLRRPTAKELPVLVEELMTYYLLIKIEVSYDIRNCLYY